MSCASDYRTKWIASWDDFDEIERPSHFHQKTMFTVFSSGTWEYKIVILPEGQKMNGTYFIECVLQPLTELYYPSGKGTHERRFMLHFDNAPVRNTGWFKRVWRIVDSEEWSVRL
jgi:hypothetical protein